MCTRSSNLGNVNTDPTPSMRGEGDTHLERVRVYIAYGVEKEV